MRKTYLEKLKDPRWQKARLRILERDNWTCQYCEDTEKTLHVHHMYYIKGKEPWEAPDNSLIVLCEQCHEEQTVYIPEEIHRLGEALKRHGAHPQRLYLISSRLNELQPSEDVLRTIHFLLMNEDLLEIVKSKSYE